MFAATPSHHVHLPPTLPGGWVDRWVTWARGLLPLKSQGCRVQRMRDHSFYPQGLFDTHTPMNIFQVQIVLSHELFLQVSSGQLLVPLNRVTQGWSWDEACCFPALFPGFRICVEKLKYKTPEAPPHTCLWGQQAALSWWAPVLLSFKGWTGRRLLKLGSDNTGPEGFASPCVSLKRGSYLTDYLPGVIF